MNISIVRRDANSDIHNLRPNGLSNVICLDIFQSLTDLVRSVDGKDE